MDTNPSYQAIGVERKISRVAVNKKFSITTIDSGRRKITKVNNKYMKYGILLTHVFWDKQEQKENFDYKSVFVIVDCENESCNEFIFKLFNLDFIYSVKRDKL